eukprot:COSAG05_NODE_15228_length_375_cov_0.746377_1_plen_67_part_01
MDAHLAGWLPLATAEGEAPAPEEAVAALRMPRNNQNAATLPLLSQKQQLVLTSRFLAAKLEASVQQS